MHDVEPRVYTASKFFTSTCFSASFLAVMAKEIVIQASSPSGTLATKIPMPKMMHCSAEYYTTKKARKKKPTPKEIAMMVMISTNRSSSVLNGDFCVPPVAAKQAIMPTTVFSAMFITIPRPRPYLHNVPKNARFLVSIGRSGSVHSGDLSSGYTSPVIGELSTFISVEAIIRRSAGTLSPLIT